MASVEVVEATLPFLTHPVAAMVRLQMFTGMRPGEARAMRADEIDRSGDVWLYRLLLATRRRGMGEPERSALGPRRPRRSSAFSLSPPALIPTSSARERQSRPGTSGVVRERVPLR